MSAQSSSTANIFVVLRQLRSLCYSNRPVTTSLFAHSLPPRFISSRAYSSCTATHRTQSTTSTNAIKTQWHSSASYSTAPPSKPEKRPVEDIDLSQPMKSKPKKPQPAWAVQKNALKAKFKEGWKPRKKVSPDTMESIRKLHSMDSVKYSTKNLAEEFKISPEAIRRILKSKWRATEAEEIDRRERWEKRKERIQEQMMELGLRHSDPVSEARPSLQEELSRGTSVWNATEKTAGGHLPPKSNREFFPKKRFGAEERSAQDGDPWDVSGQDGLIDTKRDSFGDNWPQNSHMRRGAQSRTQTEDYHRQGYRGKPNW
ncbi:Required for respiratory growth protein 9 mitochondrial [Microsporum audouinii]